MSTRRFLPLAAIVALFAVSSLIAGGLGKYKDWPSSPQGYFMTGAERAEWKATVKTEAEAEQFVNKFLASRGPGFAEEVAKSADVADKHLTVGKMPGSRTLRGKIVIVLGPPSTFNIAGRQAQGGRSGSLGGITGGGASASTSAIGGAHGGGGFGDQGSSVSDVVDAANQSAMAVTSVNDYTFTYAADKLPGKPAKPLQIVVEVNPSDGSDRINDRNVAAQLDEIFDAAAAARLASAKH
jgi:GWxTD domain-containing protein